MSNLSLFDQDVLAAIQISEHPIRVSILEHLGKKTELYTSLNRLVNLELLKFDLNHPGPLGGRPARVYKITDTGIAVLKELGRMSDKDNTLDEVQPEGNIEQSTSFESLKVQTRIRPDLTWDYQTGRVNRIHVLEEENSRLRIDYARLAEECKILSDAFHALNETCRILNSIISDFHKKDVVEETPINSPREAWSLISANPNTGVYTYESKDFVVVQSRSELNVDQLDIIINTLPKVGTFYGIPYRYRVRDEPWGAALPI